MTGRAITIRLRRHSGLIVLAVHVCLFALLTWWSWRKWPDPLIDFGRELYVPWQLTQGKVLYRDIATVFGPLSPYVNAFWFKLFGVSLTSLIVLNLAILAAVVAGIHHLLRICTDRLTATVSTLSVMLLFGFSQYMEVGNYNFVSPYAHEATHGIALSVAILIALYHGVVARRPSLFVIAGGCFGLLVLTKPETSFAASAAIVVGFISTTILGPSERTGLGRNILAFLAAAAVPPLLFFAYFRVHMPANDALQAVGGAWTMALTAPVAKNLFYLRGMGLDDAAGNANRMLLLFAGFLVFVGAAVAVSWNDPEKESRGRRVMHRFARLALTSTACWIVLVRFADTPRAFPLIVLGALGAYVVLFYKRRSDRESAVRLLPLLMWSTFAFVLLAKMWLNTRIVHYGFFLALPATTIAIVTMFSLIPSALDSRMTAGAGRRFRFVVGWVLVAAIAPYLAISHARYRDKVVTIGSGGDRFLASKRGEPVQETLRQLEQIAPGDGTLAVMPEGVIVNYLSRRESPLRHVNFTPPVLIAFGERELLQSLESRPADVIALVQRDMSEYGYPDFGTTAVYGQTIVSWVKQRYQTTAVVAETQPESSHGQVEILELRRESDR